MGLCCFLSIFGGASTATSWIVDSLLPESFSGSSGTSRSDSACGGGLSVFGLVFGLVRICFSGL